MQPVPKQPRCEGPAPLYASGGWSRALHGESPAPGASAPSASAGAYRTVIALFGLGPLLVLLLAALVWQGAHELSRAQDLQQLQRRNLSLIDTLPPFAAGSDPLQRLASRPDLSNFNYLVINHELGSAVHTSPAELHQRLVSGDDSATRLLLEKAQAWRTAAAAAQQGSFVHGGTEYLWAAEMIPGTPYTLVNIGRHAHSRVNSFLQQVSLPLLGLLLAAASVLYLGAHRLPAWRLRAPAAPAAAAVAATDTDAATLLDDLRAALAHDQLELYYQPLLDLKQQRITGVEALARWLHPRHGFIPPDAFIELAERHGLIESLTHWALRQAVAQCAEWNRAGTRLDMTINLSAQDLADAGLCDRLAALLQASRVAPQQLALEISAAAIAADEARALRQIDALRALGVRISLGDVGARGLPLTRHAAWRVDEIKLDRGVIRDLLHAAPAAALVQDALVLGRQRGLCVIAEGVETQQLLERLQHLGCEVVQGYYICRPLPAGELLPVVTACHAGNEAILRSANEAWTRHAN